MIDSDRLPEERYGSEEVLIIQISFNELPDRLPIDPVQQPLTPGPDPLTPAPSTSTDPTASAPISATQSTHPTITRTRDNTRKPRAFPDHVVNMATFHPWPLESSPTEPTCFSMANKCSIWRSVICRKLMLAEKC